MESHGDGGVKESGRTCHISEHGRELQVGAAACRPRHMSTVVPVPIAISICLTCLQRHAPFLA